jgi:adenosine deaminase
MTDHLGDQDWAGNVLLPDEHGDSGPEREYPDSEYLLAVEAMRQAVLKAWSHCSTDEAASILRGFEDEGYRWEFRK